jgi:hypothetical protein
MLFVQVTEIMFLNCQETDACMLGGMNEVTEMDLSSQFVCIVLRGNKSLAIRPIPTALHTMW